MIYIDKIPNPSGSYSNAKMQPFPSCIALDDEQAAVFFAYNGFVTVSETEGGVSVEPNKEARDAYFASIPKSTDTEPTTEEILLELAADHEARICMMELGV